MHQQDQQQMSRFIGELWIAVNQCELDPTDKNWDLVKGMLGKLGEAFSSLIEEDNEENKQDDTLSPLIIA